MHDAIFIHTPNDIFLMYLYLGKIITPSVFHYKFLQNAQYVQVLIVYSKTLSIQTKISLMVTLKSIQYKQLLKKLMFFVNDSLDIEKSIFKKII